MIRFVGLFFGFLFGLIAETFARLTLWAARGELTVNFDYLRRGKFSPVFYSDLQTENAQLKDTIQGWVDCNSEGGWIDQLRKDLAKALEENAALKSKELFTELVKDKNPLALRDESVQMRRLAEARYATICGLKEQLASTVKEVGQMEEARTRMSEFITSYIKFLAEKDNEAAYYKAEGDMYGWNFHMGARIGAIQMHLELTRLIKLLTKEGLKSNEANH